MNFLEDNVRRYFGKSGRGLLLVLLLTTAFLISGRDARSDQLRVSALANAGLAVEDRDNQINPFDFGRNPAWLFLDFEQPYIRFIASFDEIHGGLKREYDPRLANDLFVGFSGIKSLGSRQVAAGYIDYQRVGQRQVYHSLESDQYNDPFYLTDLTTGNFQYTGIRTNVDYSFRIREDLCVGGGFDYNINTGLKSVYTRPEIIHNYFRGALGVTWEAKKGFVLGLIYRPTRRLNKTKFVRTDAGYDNIIYSYAGDGIYEIRTISGYTVNELLHGHEGTLQMFYMTDELSAALTTTYGKRDTDIRYSATKRIKEGYWEEELIDIRMISRYKLAGKRLSIGISGSFTDNDGWGVRPAFDEVLLYDNPYRCLSGGAGVSYLFMPLDIMVAAEYIARKYDIKVYDYGASLFRESGVVTNIGRIAIEKNILNVYSFRFGFELTDYPVDRWLKLPQNIDRYRFTGGAGYYMSGWEIDLHLQYSRGVKEGFDEEREELAAVVWFTRKIGR